MAKKFKWQIIKREGKKVKTVEDLAPSLFAFFNSAITLALEEEGFEIDEFHCIVKRKMKKHRGAK